MSFTLNRLGKSEDMPILLEQEDLKFAECIYTALKPHSIERTLCCYATNAISIINTGVKPQPKILSGRIVPEKGVDFGLLQGWLNRCEAQHSQRCKPQMDERLRSIRLIDVNLRKVVNYSNTGSCSYVALSYMWGTAIQQSYDLSDVLNRPPPTIEDAINVTKQMGEQFLWVDSICINQSSTLHKQSQVDIMDVIYSGARVTLVALSRSDADFGLCRVQTSSINLSHADDETHHQSRCRQVIRNINGEDYTTVLPTLAQQILKSPWRYRGWTLQEALLSPRCLFFSCDQVYFQCNIMQCCESLDDSSNPIFPVEGDSQASRMVSIGKLTTVSIMDGYPTGSFINPFTALESEHCNAAANAGIFHQLKLYDYLLGLYSGRELTRDSDAIAAFGAILHQFQKKSGSEVFFGLPAAAMPWTLLWEEESYCNRRRLEFPSWSWGGWQGPLSHGHHSTVKSGANKPLVHIWKIESQQPISIFSPDPPDPKHFDFRCWKYVLSDLSRLPARTDDVDFAQFPDAEWKGLLLIDGIILRLPLSWSPPQRNRHGFPKWEYYTHIKAQFGDYTSPRLPPEEGDLGKLRDLVGKEQDFLLMLGEEISDHEARKDSALFLSLILLRWEGNVAYRVAVMYLRIQGENRDDIMIFNPQRKRIILG